MLLEHEISTAVVPVNDETLSRLCEIYGPNLSLQADCLKLRHIFQSFYLSVCQLAEAKLKDDGVLDSGKPVFNLVIDVGDDHAYIVVVDYRQDKRPFCYAKAYLKWWSFRFETLKQLAREVLDYRDTMVKKILKLTDQASQKGIK